MQAVHDPRRSSRRRARALALEEMREAIPRSTATVCLDGTDFYQILRSYVVAMKGLDEWIRAGTEVVDASRFYGPGLDIARTRDGIFTMVYQFEGKSLTVPIQGINLYVRGFQNVHGTFEFDFEDPKIPNSKNCTILDIGVNYWDLLDSGLERTLTGLWPLRKAVRQLCKFKGGPAAAIGDYIGTIAVHTSEAARTTPIHNFICRSIVDPRFSRLSKKEGLVTWIRKHRALSLELMDNIDKMYNGEAPRPIKDFGLKITLFDLVTGLRVCYREAYTAGVFKLESPQNKSHKYSSRGIGGGQGLGLYKIQRGLITTSSSKCSNTVKCNPEADKGYLTPTLSSAMGQGLTIQRKTIQIVELPCTVKPKPAMQKGYASSSYDVRCALNQVVQRETFDRAKSSYGVKCSLSQMERLSGQKGSIRRSYSVRCALSQIVQRKTFDSAKPGYGVNYSLSLMERLSGRKGTIVSSSGAKHFTAHVLTTKQRNMKSCVDPSIERSMLGHGRIYEKAKLGSTTLQQNNWANNRSSYSKSKIGSPINLLPRNLSSSFPRQNVRRYLYRAFRLLH